MTLTEFASSLVSPDTGDPIVLNDAQKRLETPGLLIAHRRVGATYGLLLRALFDAQEPGFRAVVVVSNACAVEFISRILLSFIRANDLPLTKETKYPCVFKFANDARIYVTNRAGCSPSPHGVYCDCAGFLRHDLHDMIAAVAYGDCMLFGNGNRSAKPLASLFARTHYYDIVDSTVFTEQKKQEIYSQCSYQEWIEEYQVR